MPVQPVWIAVPLALVLVGLVVGRVLLVWLKYRGDRVITCPENRRPAGVRVDAGHAVLTVGGPQLRLSDCSRWPERAGCGQECLAQIQNSPDGCLVRKILARWYEGKNCANCGRPIGEIQWSGAKPALLMPDRISVDWGQVPAERLPDTLNAALPVCFACHMANTLVREHPSLALDRSRSSAP